MALVGQNHMGPVEDNHTVRAEGSRMVPAEANRMDRAGGIHMDRAGAKTYQILGLSREMKTETTMPNQASEAIGAGGPQPQH